MTAGNAVLRAKADVLREAGLEAYHDKGDEFLCRGNHIKELVAKLERARAILRDRTIVVEQADGSTLSFTGADFSYGVGKDIDEAECGLRNCPPLILWSPIRAPQEGKNRGRSGRGAAGGPEWRGGVFDMG